MKTEVLCQKGTWPTRRQLAVGLKFLLGKWMYEGVTKEEVIKIWILSSWILENSEKENFLGFSQLGLLLLSRDFGKFLKPGKPRSGLKWIPIDDINLQYFPDAHTYYGWKGSQRIEVYLSKVRYLEIEKSKYPPPKFIGVGYKDKGTQRKPALDGSPDWKYVATHLRVGGLEIYRTNFSDPRDPRVLDNIRVLEVTSTRSLDLEIDL